MPKIDGLGLLAYRNKCHPDIPCIVMSAHGTSKIKETIQQDILQFIEKPFTADDLAQAILSVLERDLTKGSLKGISMASFLQLIELEKKTCLCEVESPNNPTGFFYFNGGRLDHALWGSLSGEEAAIKMIQLENTTINFKKVPDRKIPRKIEKGLMTLILEAMKQKDES